MLRGIVVLQLVVFAEESIVAVIVAEAVVVRVGDVQVELMVGHRLEAQVYAGHEVVHVIDHIGVLVDVHWIFVELEAAMVLAHLAALDAPLVVELVAHQEDVGSLGKVIGAHGGVVLVQTMTPTVADLVGQVALDFDTSLLVGELREGIVFGKQLLEGSSIVEIYVEGIGFLFELEDAFREALVVTVRAAHAGIASLCVSPEGEHHGNSNE